MCPITDELRAAARRILGETGDDVWCVYPPTTQRDELRVAKAYLAEHPEDDDEPVTKDRLAFAGFTSPCEANAYFWEHPTGVIAVTNGTDWIVRVCYGGTRLHNPKWWQVRDLIRVLKGGE